MHARILIITVIGTTSFVPVQDADTLSRRPSVAGEAAVGEISFQRSETEIRVLCDGEIFTSLHFDGVQKPFLYPIISTRGVSVTRGYPMDPRPGEAKDHPHHTSLWFAHGDVNGHDFWHGPHGERIVHVESHELQGMPSKLDPRIQSSFEWRDPDGGVICAEQRIMRFSADQSTRTIDFDLTLIATDQQVTFGDTKEGTFAMRLAPTLRLTGAVAQGSARNSDGVMGKDVWGKRAKWIEYSGPIDGEIVGVVIFDHPDNPRHPTWWHAREYGLVAANPFGRRAFQGSSQQAGDLEIQKGESIRMRYRMVIHDGAWDAKRLEAAYTEWTTRR
ncbi:MAG: PmoA family protein [Phycisphaerales bacterium]